MAAPLPLADEIRARAGQRQWAAIVARVEGAPEAEWREDAETTFHYADALWHVGESARALRMAEAAEGLIRRSHSHRLILDLLNTLGICHFRLGSNGHAEDRWTELLERAARWSDAEFAARACNNLGMLANLRGSPQTALVLYERAVAGYRQIGFVHGLAQTHHNLALSYRDLGRRPDADAHLRRAMRLGRRAGLEEIVAGAESERAALVLADGDPAMAEALAEQARDRFLRANDPLGAAEALRVRALAAHAGGRTADAEAWLLDALAAAGDADALLRAQVQRDRGALLAHAGRVAEAREALEESVALFASAGAATELAEARARLAELG